MQLSYSIGKNTAQPRFKIHIGTVAALVELVILVNGKQVPVAVGIIRQPVQESDALRLVYRAGLVFVTDHPYQGTLHIIAGLAVGGIIALQVVNLSLLIVQIMTKIIYGMIILIKNGLMP